jgi:hypothetical protein
MWAMQVHNFRLFKSNMHVSTVNFVMLRIWAVIFWNLCLIKGERNIKSGDSLLEGFDSVYLYILNAYKWNFNIISQFAYTT